ncbi:MAG TPA: class II fumarate hydratase [Oligoflexia bacterium]|nr:class II fumarate hydratase [Oligoflexia bacterium]HMP47297.1 class II fumarate hydratase [Oligoflexia bacterium]
MAEGFRIEKDSMGEMKVPVSAYYGAQTQRAVENFPISGEPIPESLVKAIGLVKLCSAKANLGLGLLDEPRANAIISACEEVVSGNFTDHFVVDVYQTGSGTSSNMNANEVIARRAKELAGEGVEIHPNDHVNMGQSSNDVFPTAIHVAVAQALTQNLIPALNYLKDSLSAKANEYINVLKTGRTHLQDATPMTLGQEFSGYERQIEQSIWRIQRSLTSILELPLGGTAVGTGLNTHQNFPAQAIQHLSSRTGLPFFEALNHFEAQAAKDGLVEMSGQLKSVAISLSKIANDIRWLASGPRCGIGELALPSVQPGSSIMPGKVNPVIAESTLMACARVIANDGVMTVGGLMGSTFELNVMMPVMAHSILESISLLSAATLNFSKKCVEGLEANKVRLHDLAEASIATCTALAPRIGYDSAAKLAKKAFESGKSLRQVAEEENVLPKEELDAILDLMSMTRPGV